MCFKPQGFFPAVFCILEKIVLTNISQCDIMKVKIYRSAIYGKGEKMDQHIKKVYMPMTETAFYILFCLQKPNHGYGIVQTVEKLTDSAIRLAPGTMYGSISKMEKDGVIRFVKEEDTRKIYEITSLGKEVLNVEFERIRRLYRMTQEEI